MPYPAQRVNRMSTVRLHWDKPMLESSVPFTYPPRVDLACLPTRLAQYRNLSPWIGDKELIVKHDDETGCVTSGNKIRKLEFYIAQAVQQEADTLITAGSTLSNHCRTTVFVARQLGLDVYLLLTAPPHPVVNGNYFLMQLAGAKFRRIAIDAAVDKEQLMTEMAEEVASQGQRPYIIPPGGTGELGAMSYVRAVEELKGQLQREQLRPEAITVTFGSGSTYAGLLLGTHLFGLDCRVHGISVSRNEDECHEITRELVDQTAALLDQDLEIPDEAIWVTDRHRGEGYAKNDESDFRFIKDITKATGLVLDPTYTGKALQGTLSEMRDGCLKDCKSVLFMHTGGIFGLFLKRSRFEFHEAE